MPDEVKDTVYAAAICVALGGALIAALASEWLYAVLFVVCFFALTSSFGG